MHCCPLYGDLSADGRRLQRNLYQGTGGADRGNDRGGGDSALCAVRRLRGGGPQGRLRGAVQGALHGGGTSGKSPPWYIE